MAKIGSLGTIAFKVSENKIRTLSNMKWTGSAQYATHQLHGRKAVTEFTGLEPEKISFDITLSKYLGVSPMEDLAKLWKYQRKGRALTFVLGKKRYGKYRWTILSHNVTMKTFDRKGRVTSLTVSLVLQEYLKK